MKIRMRFLLGSIGVIGITAITLGFTYAYPKLSLFDADKVASNFSAMERIFPAHQIEKSVRPQPWPEDIHPLPASLVVHGQSYDLDPFLNLTRTTSLTVLHKGTILAETFSQGYTRQSRATSFSVAKSFVSTLIGVALHKGWIRDLNDDVTLYLPELRNTSWQGVRIVDLLQMSSGTGFTEDYSDETTDAFTIFDRMFVGLNGIDALTATYSRATEPGTSFHYASINTHVLSMVLRRMSGKSLADLLQTELWEKLGAEADASWLADLHGSEIGFWGLNARPRDFARLGQLMLNDGVSPSGERILPQGWVQQATIPSRPDLVPGEINNVWGYQYQWWAPAPASAGDYSAIGIWGQFIYVDPSRDVVIVKTSADPDFWANEYNTILMFRALSEWAANTATR